MNWQSHHRRSHGLAHQRCRPLRRHLPPLLALVLFATGLQMLRAAPSLPLAPQRSWVNVTPAVAVAPALKTPGLAPSMVYDSRIEKLLLFGNGDSNFQPFSWDGVGWTQKVTNDAPPPRYAAAAAYDSLNGQSVIFGGTPDPLLPDSFAETWLLDSATSQWTRAFPRPGDQAPVARQAASMAYDPTNKEVLLFGGSTAVHASNAVPGVNLFGVGCVLNAGCSYLHLGDTWAWNGVNWRVKATGGPTPRAGAAMAYDPKRRQVVLYGGCTAPPEPVLYNPLECDGARVALQDTWVWDGSAWTEVTGEDAPQRRFGAGAVYDPETEEVILHGGGAAGIDPDDPTATAVVTTLPAVNPATTVPQARPLDPGAAAPEGSFFADTWGWDGRNWTQRPDTEVTASAFFAFGYDTRGGELVRVGGRRASCNPSQRYEQCYLAETWVYAEPASPVITAVAPAVVSPGASHTALTVHGRDLAGASSVTFDNPGLTVHSMTLEDRHTINLDISVSLDAAPGGSALTLATRVGTASCSECFGIGPPQRIVEVEGQKSPPAVSADATPEVIVSNFAGGELVRILDTLNGVTTVLSEKRVPVDSDGVSFNPEEDDTELWVTGEGPHPLVVAVVNDDGSTRTTSAPFVYRLDLTTPELLLRMTDPITSRSDCVNVEIEVPENSRLDLVIDDEDPATTPYRRSWNEERGVNDCPPSSAFSAGEITASVVVTDRLGNVSPPRVVTSLKIDEDELVPVDPPVGVNSGKEPVIITAKGLATAKSVRFGSTSVPFTRTSSYRLEVTTPRHPVGVTDLVVETATGTITLPYRFVAGGWRTAEPLTACSEPAAFLSCDARYLHTATLLDGPACRAVVRAGYCGKVLVAGGTVDYFAFASVERLCQGSSDPNIVGACVERLGLRSAQVYNPENGRWSVASSMSVTRFQHTATLLDGPECHVPLPLAPSHCGKVLVVGGQGPRGEGVGSAELYDPATDTWLPAGSLAVPRFHHTATLLYDDGCMICTSVVIAGGATYEPARPLALSSSEIYNPLTNTWVTGPPMGEARVNHTAVTGRGSVVRKLYRLLILEKRRCRYLSVLTTRRWWGIRFPRHPLWRPATTSRRGGSHR